MPYPKHWLLSFGGALAQRDEWACNIRMVVDGFLFDDPLDSSDADEEAALDNYGPAVLAFVRSAGARFSPEVFLDYVKLNEISPDGTYADKSTTHARYFDGTRNGGASDPAPLDQSMAVSWLTEANRGAASKGRIYLPPSPQPTFGPGGVFVQGNIQNTASAVATLLDALTPGITGGLRPAVVSSGTRDRPGGAFRYITGLRIGNVPDRQSRRRRNTPEEYYSVTF